MTFEYDDIVFNLLDTPGHEDFSEDTYRTLTAVDSAVMVIDAAKGIEPQTRKLFEVCRLRSVPIITFVNKIDREGRDAFELLDEIADQLRSTSRRWNGRSAWAGCSRGCTISRQPADAARRATARYRGHVEQLSGLDDPRLDTLVSPQALARLREEAELAVGGYADVRSRQISPRRPDAGLFRLGAQGFRRRPS